MHLLRKCMNNKWKLYFILYCTKWYNFLCIASDLTFISSLFYVFVPKFPHSIKHALKTVTSISPIPYFLHFPFCTSVNLKTFLSLEKCKATENWNAVILSFCYILNTFSTFWTVIKWQGYNISFYFGSLLLQSWESFEKLHSVRN